jgi:hypothetical protein
MPTTLASVLLAAITHGAFVVPLLWVIGVILLLAGVVSLFRGGLLAGLLLIIVGVLLGGLNVF